METIRDSAFGKLVRLATRYRIFRYPEEADSQVWKLYVKTEKEAKREEEEALEENPESYGLYTALSQASKALSRTKSSADVEKLSRVKTSAEGVICWSGPDDAENPQNWSTTKKFLVSSMVWLLTTSIYIGSAIYTPGITGVSEQFHVSEVAATLGLTLFVLGYGFGPMIWSPLSELPAIGRSPIYLLTLGVFVLFNFPVIYASNFGMFLAFRFLTGFIGSPALATGAASMGDIWNPKVRDYMIGVWGAFAISAPVLGPTIGGFAASANGWTWTIWPLLWLSGFTFVVLFFFLPETYAPNILARRARRVRRITGNASLLSESEIELENIPKKDLLFEALVRPFSLTLTEPVVFLMDLYISLIYAILYVYFEAFPIVFGEIHGFNLGEVGLAFMGILISTCCIVLPAYFWWKYKYQSKYFDENGNLSPERQLPPACVGAICLPVSLFWFGWTGNYENVHWIVPIISTMLFSVGGCLIFNCIFTYQAHAYPKFAASVLAGNDCMRSTFGAAFPLFATAMFHNLGVNWASSTLAFLTLVFVPYPFLLLKYGKKLRMASKYARHDI